MILAFYFGSSAPSKSFQINCLLQLQIVVISAHNCIKMVVNYTNFSILFFSIGCFLILKNQPNLVLIWFDNSFSLLIYSSDFVFSSFFLPWIILQNLMIQLIAQQRLFKFSYMDIIKKIKNYTYNQRHCLGEGSFGRVFEGRSDEGLQIAIKKVQQRMISKDAYLRSSLESEINIMKKLNHENIVKLYDVVLTSNSIYLIMQFCAGGDLKRYCRNKKLSEDQGKRIIKQISSGFQEIVKRGIIHRDLKPANILVHEGMFKICDFGFAKFFGEEGKMARTCVGTPIYMSPQVLNQQSYTNKTDIWSLGILYFELLFGKLPFSGVTEQELYRNIIRGPLSIPSCSKFTYNILKGMLQVQQNKRFSWNKMFEAFELSPINDYPPQIPKQENANNFYKQKQQKQLRQQKEFLPKNQFARQQRQEHRQVNNFLPNPINAQNINTHNEEQKKYIKKPKNPMAYQVLGPPPAKILENSPQKQIQKNQEQNPRFFYFVLIELIVNPIENCQYYPIFVSSLYRSTVLEYEKKIDGKNQPLDERYKKVLQSELEQLKAIESEIPNYVQEDLMKAGESLLNQSKELMKNKSSLGWVQKLLTKKYDYKPIQ